MDANKEQKLRLIGYVIKQTCAVCEHSEFKPGQAWGTCKLHMYSHLKHTGPERQLSIHILGKCNSFKLDTETIPSLHGYGSFFGL